MFVDGYGNDVVAVSFTRTPGQSPSVEIHTPRAVGSKSQPLSAFIDERTWQRVLNSSRDFDKKLEGEARRGEPDKDGNFIICVHGWFVVVEAADASQLDPNVYGQQMRPSEIRRDAEGSCAGGLAVPYAFSLADFALDALPECSSLDADDARNEAALLALCHNLAGDRIAAGQAYQFARELRSADLLADEAELRRLFAASARNLVAPFKAAVAGGDLYLDAPSAADADHARVQGQVLFRRRKDGKDEIADITLQLVRQTGDFVISSYEISELRPHEWE